MQKKLLQGSKTYIIAIGLICYAIGGLVAGKVDAATAIQSVFIALGMMGIRHGVTTEKNI